MLSQKLAPLPGALARPGIGSGCDERENGLVSKREHRHCSAVITEVNGPSAGSALLKRCIEAVARRFSDDVVAVDLTVFNAARIWTVYGTPCLTESSSCPMMVCIWLIVQ